MKTPPWHWVGMLSLGLIALAAGSQVIAQEPAVKVVKQGKVGGAATAAKAAPPPAAPLSEADKQRRAQAVVTYKGGQITVGDLEDAIARQSPFMRARYKDPASMKELLDKTLRFALLSDEADRRGYAKDPVVDQSVKQNAVQQLMKREFDEKLSAETIPKEQIDQYYQQHVDEYVQPAMQRASHVMVATEPEAKELLAQAKAMDLRAFRQLARDKSIDEASKLRGGDLRYFDVKGRARGETEASVPPAIVRAAFALKTIGDTAPQPIKIPGGFSIVKLTGLRPAISRKPGEVEETIRVRLWREVRQKAIDDFVANLRSTQKPELHPELTDAIKLDEAPPVRGPGLPEGFPTGAPPDPPKPQPLATPEKAAPAP